MDAENSQKGNSPTCLRTRYCMCYRRSFFRRSRLFFREAAFSSGSEGCEWRAQRATVGESGDKAENEFSGFIPLVVPRMGFSPHIPASRLFALFHTTQATKPHQIKQPLSKIAVNERAVYRPTPRCLQKFSPTRTQNPHFFGIGEGQIALFHIECFGFQRKIVTLCVSQFIQISK